MTQIPGDLATLEPLEPLEAGGPGGAVGAMTSDEALLQALRSGLPAPAVNPFCRDKTYYRFLWAGIMIFVGCLMPFDANYGAAGYQTLSGAIYLLIGLGMIRTWWGTINSNRSSGSSILWLLACVGPLVAVIMNMMAFVPATALEVAHARGYIQGECLHSASWGAMFGDMGSALAKDNEAAARVGNFWRLFGPGQVLVFLGALLAELGFFGGVLGGHKKNKQLQQQKQEAAAEKRRRK
ncbi:MAG: hypothetical protein KDC98_14915 [Planctomycetes bacterium]|nr:hypothetical protein [Planctomycetota bacterium]